MSYSSNRRDALDAALPLSDRASHARSCAMLVAHKLSVHRGVVLDRVRELSGVDLMNVQAERELVDAMDALERLRFGGEG